MTIAAIILIAVLVAFVAGGFLLRFAGAVVAFAGISSLAFRSLGGGMDAVLAISMIVVGGAAWLAGHWHFAWRHHFYKSPVAERAFGHLFPARLDPTGGWIRHLQRRQHQS